MSYKSFDEGDLFELEVADGVGVAVGAVRLAEAEVQHELTLAVAGHDRVGEGVVRIRMPITRAGFRLTAVSGCKIGTAWNWPR